MLRRINDALPGLVLGIIVYGVIVELAGVWFVTDKVRYTTGLLIGISLACGMAVNIATVLRDAVELYGEDNAKKKIVAKSLLRYAVVVIVKRKEAVTLADLCYAWENERSIPWIPKAP